MSIHTQRKITLTIQDQKYGDVGVIVNVAMYEVLFVIIVDRVNVYKKNRFFCPILLMRICSILFPLTKQKISKDVCTISCCPLGKQFKIIKI
jgi:hypothetical protein